MKYSATIISVIVIPLVILIVLIVQGKGQLHIYIKPSKRQLSHLIGVCYLSILFLLLFFIVIVDSLVDGLHCERSKLPLQHLFIAICFELSDHLTNLLRNSSGRFHSTRERERERKEAGET